MADRRKPLTKKLQKASMSPKDPMSPLEKSITKWLKENVPIKKTKFLHSHVVEYFIGRKAVDLLTEESPWALIKETESSDFHFSSREHCVEVLDTLLRHKMFHRAKKIPVIEDKEKKVKRKDSKDKSDNEQEKEKIDSEPERKDSKSELEGEDEKPKKRKIRLDMHLDQMFIDSSDAYVWLYDPIPWYYWIAGGAIVMLVVAFCLFPLWPRPLRRGAHWIAFLSACFMVAVLCVALLKYAIFAMLYGLSGTKLKFWILPNLTEDVSFLASFWPLYAYTYTGDVLTDEDEDRDDQPKVTQDDSDSNESGKSTFEFVEKSKDE